MQKIICNLYSEKMSEYKRENKFKNSKVQNEYSIRINNWLEITIYYILRAIKKSCSLIYFAVLIVIMYVTPGDH